MDKGKGKIGGKKGDQFGKGEGPRPVGSVTYVQAKGRGIQSFDGSVRCVDCGSIFRGCSVFNPAKGGGKGGKKGEGKGGPSARWKEFVEGKGGRDERLFRTMPKQVRNSLQAAFFEGIEDLDDLPADFRADKEIVLAGVKARASSLLGASKELKDDKEVVLAAVRSAGHALQYASTALQADREVVLEAVRNPRWSCACAATAAALMYASDSLRADREVVLEAVAAEPWSLQEASPSLRADRGFILEAVATNGYVLELLCEELRADREIVLAAVKNDGTALRFANEALTADKEVVQAAVENDGQALQYASRSSRADKEVMLAAVKIGGTNLWYASDGLRADKEIVLAAVKNDGNALRYACEAFRADREVVLAAVSASKRDACGRLQSPLEYASPALRADKAVVLAAVQRSPDSLEYAGGDLRDDREIVLAAVRQGGWVLRFASKALKSDWQIATEAVRCCIVWCDYVNDDLRWNKDFVLFLGRLKRDLGNGLHSEEAGITDWDDFQGAVAIPLALAGEEGAPSLSVTMQQVSGKERRFHCEASLLSGANFVCEIPENSDDKINENQPGRHGLGPEPILNDLVTKLVQELPKIEAKSAKRVFLNFTIAMDADGTVTDAISVTPWDWNRPLTDFLLQQPPLGEEGCEA